MFKVVEQLEKDNIILQLTDSDGAVVGGFNYRVSTSKMRDAKLLRKMLDRECSLRNRKVERGGLQ